MPYIVPIKDLKSTSKISELCHSTDEPVFITKNGYGDMVIMSMDAYEKALNNGKSTGLRKRMSDDDSDIEAALKTMKIPVENKEDT